MVRAEILHYLCCRTYPLHVWLVVGHPGVRCLVEVQRLPEVCLTLRTDGVAGRQIGQKILHCRLRQTDQGIEYTCYLCLFSPHKTHNVKHELCVVPKDLGALILGFFDVAAHCLIICGWVLHQVPAGQEQRQCEQF